MGLGAVQLTTSGSVVEYASRALTQEERKYATIEKECLAIVWATRKFRHYLIGSPFVIQTNHKPLKWLVSSKSSRARSQRPKCWSLELRAHDFHIVHHPGSTNQHADALSRRPVALVAVSPLLDETQNNNTSLKSRFCAVNGDYTLGTANSPTLQRTVAQISTQEIQTTLVAADPTQLHLISQNQVSLNDL